MPDLVLQIESLYKRYRLGVVNRTALREDLQAIWARVRGKSLPADRYVTANELATAKKEDLKANYVWALQDINLEVKRGEILGIIGKNGAGKSTLLKILSKTTAPTRGQVRVKGRIASLLEVGTGFHPELTGRENIYLNGLILGMKRVEITKKLDEIVDFAGVENFLDTPVKRYSSGMTVRLGFAVAAHLEPDILVVDEVLAVGDAEFQKKAIGKMQEVSQGGGRTVLFVSHQMDMVRALCKRVVLLQNGQVAQEGTPKEVIDGYLMGSGSSKTKLSVSIAPDESIPVQILNARIYSTGGGEIFDIFKEITLEIEYVVRQEINGVSINFLINKNEQFPLVLSCDTDVNPELLTQLRAPGHYTTKITFPAPFFKAGNYAVCFNVGVPRRKVIHTLSNVLSFNVDALSYSTGFMGLHGKRPGEIATLLEWTTTQKV